MSNECCNNLKLKKLILDKIFSTEWYIKQQEIEEELIIEQINKHNDEENEKWIQAEKIAIAQWKKLQEEKERLKQKRLEQEAKLKLVRLRCNVFLSN